MHLPEGVILFKEEDRDYDGLYVILAGMTHVHECQIPLLGSLKITVKHIGEGEQDFSIRMWIGSEPLNDVLLKYQLGEPALNKIENEYVIYDALNAPEGAWKLPSNKPIYLNLLNRQNSTNGYMLVFTPVEG